MSHYISKCKHGAVISQCRCPSSDKFVHIVECDHPDVPAMSVAPDADTGWTARHSHMTRDIKPEGQCPACDKYHAKWVIRKSPRTLDGMFVAPDGNEHPCIWQARPDADPRLLMARPHEDAPERRVWDLVAAIVPERAGQVQVEVARARAEAGDGVSAIAAERARQVRIGHDLDHDRHHPVREFVAQAGDLLGVRLVRHPWCERRSGDEYHRDDLVRAGALIAAAIDRLAAREAEGTDR